MLWNELGQSVGKGKRVYEQFLANPLEQANAPYREIYLGQERKEDTWRNRFFVGDNREALQQLLMGNPSLDLPSMAGKVNLIYIDPPFDSQRIYHYQVNLGKDMLRQVAYEDRWPRATFDYLEMLTLRLCLMRDLLAEDGSILVHIDYHISHYVKLLMDDIFGRNRFMNEIVWCYGGGGAPKKHYTRKHDVILWYTKGKEWFFQPQYRPYRQGTIERGLTAVKGDRYELHREGATLDDWWSEPEVQKFLSPTAKENAKYETQKPEGLLRRIIQGHSQENDLVADFFCGSGTTGLVAEKMNRRWIMADQAAPAFRISRRRLLEWPSVRTWEAIRQDLPSRPEQEKPRNLQFHGTIQETLGGKVLQVSLIDYQIPQSSLASMSAQQRKLVEDLQQQDWLKFIEYWDIDSHYQSGIFHAEYSSVRSYEGKKAGIRSVDWQLSVPWNEREQHQIALRVVDIFGNEQIILTKVDEKSFPMEDK